MAARRDGPSLSDALWLRSLARRVAGDDRADDLAQEVLLAALTGRRPRGNRRAWLAAILRNLARLERRREARRLRREAVAAARPPRPLDMELRARLDAAVDALPEPIRSTVQRRFGEAMTCAAIARADGVPPSTARNRLRRGLALLRARLRREYGGDPRALAIVALPAPRRRRPARWAAAAAALLGLAAHVAAAPAEPPGEPVPVEQHVDDVLTIEPEVAPWRP